MTMTKAYNFEYDGLRLSDFGFMLCSFDGSKTDTVSNGSEIKFNTVSTMSGMKHELTSSSYEDCLTATFQICKNYCDYSNDEEISIEDMRDIMRWLNRKEFHKFKLIDYDGEYAGIYFEASFNISRIEINGRLYGFELEMFTNRPFGLREQIVVNIDTIGIDKITGLYDKKIMFSNSDEEGHIYPNMEIVIGEDGDLEIYNSMENRVMRIANCKKDEVITIEYPMIKSSIDSHKIRNDFNWVFFRIVTTFKNKLNEITTSLPCSIKMVYTPIVKIGI